MESSKEIAFFAVTNLNASRRILEPLIEEKIDRLVVKEKKDVLDLAIKSISNLKEFTPSDVRIILTSLK